MNDLIQQCKSNFGLAPREFSWWDRLTYFCIPLPMWLIMRPHDKLMRHFWNLGKLWREGTVVWGCMVQANTLMFEDNDFSCPGEIVYSLVDSHKATPDYLRQLAAQLFSLKGTRPSEEGKAKIAAHLTNEWTRVYGLEVPPNLSPSVRCHLSITYLARKHLPDKRLCSNVLPIIVSPLPPYYITPLPERFWPHELIDNWMNSD